MALRQIMLAGQVLHGTDARGVWVVNKLTGWFQRPAPKGNTADRTNSDGEYDLPDNYGARIITIMGRVSCRTPAEAASARDAILGTVLGTVRMRVQSVDSNPTFAMVKPAGEVDAVVLGRMVRFTFTLKAVDPRRFGEVRKVSAGSGTAAAVQNRGNFPASPLIVVDGPVAAGGYTVTGPGGELFTVTTSPGSGTTHLIDMHDGLLRVNGSMSTGAGLVSQADVVTIPAGGKANVTLSKGGRVELYDTYM